MTLPKMPTKMPNRKTSKVKIFHIKPWTGANEGEKVMIYAVTKMGKTTLASLAPDPALIGVDDGGRKIKHPITGADLNHVPGIESFQDVRSALQSNVFDDCRSIVIDTITFVEHWCEQYVLATVPKPKSQGGGSAKNIHDYGYHEGFKHLQNAMDLLLPDFDRWVRKGKNIIILAQETTHKWKTSDVEEFLMAGPALYHSRSASVALSYMSRMDHIFRIAYNNRIVEKGRIAPVQERAIFVQPDATFFAGSRGEWAKDYPVVSFNKPSDASIWNLMFGANHAT